MSEQARLKWACRRGMRELDILLERYLAQHYRTDSVPRQAAFRRLLELTNPELIDYLLGAAAPPAELEDLVADLRGQEPP